MSTLREALEWLVEIHDRDEAGDPDRIATPRGRREAWEEARQALQTVPTLPHDWTLQKEYAGGRSQYIVLVKDGDATHDESVVDERLEEARRVLGMEEASPCRHPFPWKVVHDWTAEIKDADGDTVTKVLHRHGTDQARAVASAVEEHQEEHEDERAYIYPPADPDAQPTPEEPVGALPGWSDRDQKIASGIDRLIHEGEDVAGEDLAWLIDKLWDMRDRYEAAFQREPVGETLEDVAVVLDRARLRDAIREANRRYMGTDMAGDKADFVIRALTPVAGEEDGDRAECKMWINRFDGYVHCSTHGRNFPIEDDDGSDFCPEARATPTRETEEGEDD